MEEEDDEACCSELRDHKPEGSTRSLVWCNVLIIFLVDCADEKIKIKNNKD